MVCYTLFSGSSGNCIYIKEKNTSILIDAGQSLKRIKEELSKIDADINDISAVWVTHEHSDHTKGIPKIAKELHIPIYCQNEVARSIYFSLLDKDASEAKELAKCIRTVNTDSVYESKDIMISPFKTPHDSADSCGYVLGNDELGIATDLGHITDEVANSLLPCKNIILESNYDKKMLENGSYPPYLKARILSESGHLDNEDCARFSVKLLEKGCENITLFHISKDNNTHELAYSVSEKALNDAGAKIGSDIKLSCAVRGGALKVL